MMKQIAIIYSSIDGQTHKIAKYLADQIKSQGHQVFLQNTKSFNKDFPWNDIDKFILGAPVHMGHYPLNFSRFIQKNRMILQSKPSAFFSVSLAAAGLAGEGSDDPLDYIRAGFEKWDWWPDSVASFAGAIRYQDYNWFKRALMRQVARASGGSTNSSQNYEYTDWTVVDRFQKSFLNGTPTIEFGPLPIPDRLVHLREIMPDFDYRFVEQIEIPRPVSVVYEALKNTRVSEAKLASSLAAVRTLGRSWRKSEQTEQKVQESFLESAKNFGLVLIKDEAPREISAGLIGKFWQLNFGIKKVPTAEAFHSFNEPGFTRVTSNFYLEESQNGTILSTETRMKSTDKTARRLFDLYWTVYGYGIRLYMKSILAAIKRRALGETSSAKEPKQTSTSSIHVS